MWFHFLTVWWKLESWTRTPLHSTCHWTKTKNHLSWFLEAGTNHVLLEISDGTMWNTSFSGQSNLMMSSLMDSLLDTADLILERIAIWHPIQVPLLTLSQAGHTNSSWNRTEKRDHAKRVKSMNLVIWLLLWKESATIFPPITGWPEPQECMAVVVTAQLQSRS